MTAHDKLRQIGGLSNVQALAVPEPTRSSLGLGAQSSPGRPIPLNRRSADQNQSPRTPQTQTRIKDAVDCCFGPSLSVSAKNPPPDRVKSMKDLRNIAKRSPGAEHAVEKAWKTSNSTERVPLKDILVNLNPNENVVKTQDQDPSFCRSLIAVSEESLPRGETSQLPYLGMAPEYSFVTDDVFTSTPAFAADVDEPEDDGVGNEATTDVASGTMEKC